MSKVVPAGFFYADGATVNPKVQPVTWRFEDSDLADLSVVLVTHKGNDHSKIHMTRADAARLAVALVRAGPQD